MGLVRDLLQGRVSTCACVQTFIHFMHGQAHVAEQKTVYVQSHANNNELNIFNEEIECFPVA